MTTLESDEGNADDSYSTHLQFLEEFFSVILPGMPAAGIYLVRLTDNKGEYHAKLVVK